MLFSWLKRTWGETTLQWWPENWLVISIQKFWNKRRRLQKPSPTFNEKGQKYQIQILETENYNVSEDNYTSWPSFWQILEEKRVARISLDLSHSIAASIATHWFVVRVQVITIHHLHRLNTSLQPEGWPGGGAFASPRSLIHKINWKHVHLSKRVEYIYINCWQTKVTGPCYHFSPREKHSSSLQSVSVFIWLRKNPKIK